MDSRTQSLEEAILSAWHLNAQPWTSAVQEQRIESRRLATDRAIIEAVLACAPRQVIDIGCGEGWLARVLSAQGLDVMGVDAVSALVDQARALGRGRFECLSYAELAAGALDERADVAVCNFSLLGKASVEALLTAVPGMLNHGGVLIVQTLHPLMACGDAPYRDGWRDGSWAGCGEGFSTPAPWYFRTLGGWLDTFTASGLRVIRVDEPLHPETGRPASIIFVLAPAHA
ncbi:MULTISPECIES: class I SAM-dependent methyltransferase [Dyella]|uniref:Methyltransferase domain-containing protein n=2 Tax=Dyella TaxID=231454 RepID=A0A4R0YU28_9GAMM|nr:MULTISPECIES: methyltransferase domain-containing protein [Dyella]TBR39636.1 methyltransferase domain-containing protein [Dyella terrae]TCI12782.1 methyltransferase domain-containing protein [Dyella soli]